CLVPTRPPARPAARHTCSARLLVELRTVGWAIAGSVGLSVASPAVGKHRVNEDLDTTILPVMTDDAPPPTDEVPPHVRKRRRLLVAGVASLSVLLTAIAIGRAALSFHSALSRVVFPSLVPTYMGPSQPGSAPGGGLTPSPVSSPTP